MLFLMLVLIFLDAFLILYVNPFGTIKALLSPYPYVIPLFTFTFTKLLYRLGYLKTPKGEESENDREFYKLDSKFRHLSYIIFQGYAVAVVYINCTSGCNVPYVWELVGLYVVSICFHEILEIVFKPF